MGGESDSVVSNEDNSRKGSSPKTFPCRFCFRIFSRVRGLNRHMSTHLQEMRNEARALLEQNYWKMNNQLVAPQNYASIPGGMQTQVQTWGQTGCPSSLSTYSNQNVGGGISGVGPSLPTSYLNQQQLDRLSYQMRERYPSLPYQRNNNLQRGGGASVVNNSGISGPSLPTNSHLQIRGPSFPTLQGGNPNLVVSGYAAASASEQQQQSAQAILQHLPRFVQPSAPSSSATEEIDEVRLERK